MTGKKERFTAFVKEMEGTSLEGGVPGMEKLLSSTTNVEPRKESSMT